MITPTITVLLVNPYEVPQTIEIPADLSAAAAVEAFIGNWLYIPTLGLPLVFGLITKMFHVKQ